MKSIKNWIIALIIAASAGGVLMTMATPQTASADCNSGFLGFPAWYRGLTNRKCEIKSPDNIEGGLSNFIWHIGLNVVEMALVAVAYLSGFFFLYGGYLFIISQGKPEGAAKARTTMLQAVIGLVVSVASIAIVTFIVTGILK